MSRFGIQNCSNELELDYRQNGNQLRVSAARTPMLFEGILFHPWDHVSSVRKENYLKPTPSHSLAGISEEAEKGKQRPTKLRLVYCSLLIRT